jgi:hypothetical protein
LCGLPPLQVLAALVGFESSDAHCLWFKSPLWSPKGDG